MKYPAAKYFFESEEQQHYTAEFEQVFVTAYNKQRNFKPKYSTDKLYCILGVYNLIAIIKILNIRLCNYNQMCY